MSCFNSMGDTTSTIDDRAIRKRDLLDGPNEFDHVRIDRPRRSKSDPGISRETGGLRNNRSMEDKR